MPSRAPAWPAALMVLLLILAPQLPSSPASGGSTWSAGGPDLKNGTLDGTAWTQSGIRLPYNATLLNNWTRVDPWPGGRYLSNMVYDDRGGRFILFGGITLYHSYTNLNETWTYDLATDTWTNRTTLDSPRAGDEQSMAYDSANGIVVLFGSDIYTDATWTYNASSSIWTNMYPWPTPRGRIGHTMAYDKANGVMILFGGWVGGEINDTWAYNVSNNTWTDMKPADAPPCCPRYAMAYDESTGEMVLFGGGGSEYSGYNGRNDTWTYNYTANTWTQKRNASAPPPRIYGKMVYDPVIEKSVLFGGSHANMTDAVTYNDTWTYDARNDQWDQIITTGDVPSKRYGQAMGYDSSRHEIVIFGGMDPAGVGDETFSLNLTTKKWSRLSQAPSARGIMAMTAAPNENAAVLFGGGWGTGFNDTWTFDFSTNRWKDMRPSKSPHYDNGYLPLTYDTAAGLAVMYTSSPYISTWVYNISQNTWTDRHPYTVPPGPRSGYLFAYDEANRYTVLSCGGGGNFFYDTWVYYSNNNTWEDRQTTSYPAVRSGTTMVYDRQNKVMVTFGGSGPYSVILNDTWLYNGSNNTWFEVKPPTSPEPRYLHQMVYDDALGEIVLYGGFGQSGELSDTWTYNTSLNRWTRIYTATRPTAMYSAGIACDGRSGTVILFGGYDGRPVCDDTYAFNLRQHVSPGCYTSAPLDTGGEAYFGELRWNASVPNYTTLAFQFRAADTPEALNSSGFAGPDGTNATYYNSSGQNIFPGFDGSRWMQYRAHLASSNLARTPVLNNVTIQYNLIHSASLLSPAGGENWTGVQEIRWTASDPDNDSLSVDIDLLWVAGEMHLASGLDAGDGALQWDTSFTENGTYRIRITVRDDNQTIPLSINMTSPEFVIFHPHVNEAPSAELVYPENGAVITTDVVNLTWTGSDPENDTIDYTVYVSGGFFDAENLPAEGNVTYDTFYELTGLSDLKTYWWTVVPCDGQLPGSVPEVRNFTIDLPHAPEIELISPADNARFNTTSVELRWRGSDADNDTLFYLVYINSTQFEISTLPPGPMNTSSSSQVVSGLVNGTTYYWTVVPCDPVIAGAVAPVRSFTIDISIGNRLPRITSAAPPNVTSGDPYEYNLTAVDDDLDPVTFSKIAGPAGLTVNETTGRVSWRPNATGNFTVTVRATDSKGGFSDQIFNIEVKSGPPVIPRPPTLSITSVLNNTKVRKTITIEGKAAVGSLPVTLVQYKVDDGPWQAASGTENWSFTLDTTALKNGRHAITLRAYDGTYHSAESVLDIDVSNAAAAPVEAAFPWWVIAVVVVVAAAAGVAVALSRRTKTAAPPEDEKPAPEGEPAGAKARTEAEPEAPDEPAAGSEKAPLPPGAEEISIKVGEKPEPAKVPAAPPAAPPAAALRAAPEGFAVEDIFLMYIDGRLIQHTTRRIKADMDVDIMTSMLKAVQDFVKESIGQDSHAELGSMEYGGSKILLEKGKQVALAVVLEGGDPEGFRDEMRSVIRDIEVEFAPVLQSWDGMARTLAGTKRFLARLGEYSPPEKKAPVGPAKGEVSVKSEVEFYQGFVRLKVAIKNGMPTMIGKATFKLMYSDTALRLDHIEPSIEMKGEEVVLGMVEPREKKTIAFYLDPQICTESFLEGVLTYKDAMGNLEMIKMPKKLTSVVCPILFTDQNINTAMLKRMAAEELDSKDTKVFSFPPRLEPKKAFEIAKAAVQHHDIRLVREFFQETPYIGEAWYHGTAKGREDRIIVRARVLGERNILEFFVASSSTLMLTGMLAELKSDLNRELEGQKMPSGMKQVTDPDVVDTLAHIRTLLDKSP